jgi:hypothetical protein
MKIASNRLRMIGLTVSVAALGVLSVVAAAADGSQTPASASRARIFGTVRDFSGNPIEGADVEIKTARFENAAATRSAADGSFSLTVETGMYIALAAVKDYQVSKLEYWAWNVPAFGEVEINPRFDRLEVYGLNAWRPQGGFPSYQIYFRPMSLTMTIAAVTKAGGMDKLGGLSFIDIAPDLTAKDIAVRIDGESVEVLRVNKVQEAGGPAQALYGYLIQTPLPKAQGTGDWVTVDVTLSDPATGEKGEGRLYVARPRYVQGAPPKPPSGKGQR